MFAMQQNRATHTTRLTILANFIFLQRLYFFFFIGKIDYWHYIKPVKILKRFMATPNCSAVHCGLQ